MKTYYLYIHINKSNNKVYIGWSGNPKARWDSGQGYNRKCHRYFWHAIQKYGWSGFYHIIICSSRNQEHIKQLEREYIALYNANNPQFGYNMTMGGDGRDMGKDCYNPVIYKAKHKQYYEEHREEIKTKAHQWYQENKESMKEYNKENHIKHKEEHNEKCRQYHAEHKEWRKAHDKAYKESHKEERKARDKAYKESHKEERKAWQKKYIETHKEKVKEYHRAYYERKKLEKQKQES